MRSSLPVVSILVAAAGFGCVVGEDNVDEKIRPVQLPEVPQRFTTFETGQVRPLALAASGKTLYAVNTPDNRLEIYSVKHHGLQWRGSVPVGLEPVAVAARNDDEVWVVNHLSDSVSIVNVENNKRPYVARTLLVGDEPRDIVFAGVNRNRAFITTAHRGQNSPVDPQLSTPGVGRADVFVYDANALGASLGGTPLTVVTLFSDTPRALAVSNDGRTVYAAAFNSGNQTTVISKGSTELNGGTPLPNTITIQTPLGPLTIGQPKTGLIVKFRDGHWLDRVDRQWDALVNFNLPDKDVFTIDAAANPPVQTGFWQTVGTTLFSMAVNPRTGKIYVANTDARNDVRFEGHGNALPGTGDKTVRGHIAESRITVISGTTVTPRHLNKHINYAVDFTAGENEKSLAFPQGMAVSRDGTTLYVAALGSSKVGIYSTSQLENDTFVPSTANQVTVSGGGPTGIVLDERNDALYVLTRFDNSISIIDTDTHAETGHVAMYNPEPAVVTDGRPILYDASLTSSHGDSACASCHIFGDMDHLSWDLGNPDGRPLPIPEVFTVPKAVILQLLPFVGPVFAGFMPLKGPMTTQSFRGMDNHGAMHWRGDRNGGFNALGQPIPSVQPDSGVYSEQAAFKAFNVAFPGLLGRGSQLNAEQMQAFTNFSLEIMYPPNPIRNLDNSLTAQQQAGRDFYFASFVKPDGTLGELPSDRLRNCNGCHVLKPTANAEFGVTRPGFFGTSGLFSFENEPQIVKVPHLRNQYQKVGMFGMAPDAFFGSAQGSIAHTGDQIRGFGFLHDGACDTEERFFTATAFNKSTTPQPNPGGPSFPPLPPNPFGIPIGAEGMPLRRALEAFMLAFDSNLAPIVGQQVTLDANNGAAVAVRIDLLEARAATGECDLVASGRIDGHAVAYLLSNGAYASNRTAEPALTSAELRGLVVPDGTSGNDDSESDEDDGGDGGVLTYTCTPPASGRRIGLDRDGDGYADGDEVDYGTDPANAASHP